MTMISHTSFYDFSNKNNFRLNMSVESVNKVYNILLYYSWKIIIKDFKNCK